MTIPPQANAVKPLVNRLDDETIMPDIHASYTHVIDEKFWWIYELRFVIQLFCRQNGQTNNVEFGLN